MRDFFRPGMLFLEPDLASQAPALGAVGHPTVPADQPVGKDGCAMAV